VKSAPAEQGFAFGKNWSSFLEVVSAERIAEAEKSLTDMLETDNLAGKSFLDIGSGSGLFSLAAMRLGAAHVHSFDFDPASVTTTLALREQHFPSDSRWRVESGDVIDRAYMAGLDAFDVVYAWGVLHHTGDMMTGLANVASAVGTGGQLFVAIYNDQGRRSRVWRRIKHLYNRLPARLRPAYVIAVTMPGEVRALVRAIFSGAPRRYIELWTRYEEARGMSRWHDMVDWVGGYPFEVAQPEEIFGFYRERGFEMTRLVTRDRGCNEFVFRRAR
jgi:2-polyprenyl-3-methyl-5-hydroxy-6-metoxy-1,4-benzoquinol methylase